MYVHVCRFTSISGHYTLETFHHLLQDLHSEYGDIARMRVGSRWMVFLFNPQDIKSVFYNDEKYPYRTESKLMKTYGRRKGVKLGLSFL